MKKPYYRSEMNKSLTMYSLYQNIVSLGILQGTKYLLPLITLPYLTRVLGPQSYGKLSFIQILMQYFIILTDYGFSWSATRNIASKRDDINKVSEIFATTWVAQAILALFALLVLLVLMAFIPLIRQDKLIYFGGFLAVIGNVLFPLWLLNGLERMREIMVLNVGSRLILLIPLFIFVSSPDDMIWAVCITSSSTIFAGIISLIWIRYTGIVYWQRPNFIDVLQTLREGSMLFISKASISVYTTVIPLILGAIAGTTVLGFFNLADKIRTAAQSILNPISQALYPRMSCLFANAQKDANIIIKWSLIATVLISGTTSAILWIFSHWIILFLAGESYLSSVVLLKWVAFLPLIIGLSNVFGVQVMLPNHHTSAFTRILIVASIVSFIIAIPLIFYKKELGAAITFFITECFVTFSMAIYVLKTMSFKLEFNIIKNFINRKNDN